MSFLTASFITLLLGGLAFFFLLRQRHLGLKAKLGGSAAIALLACLLFFGLFYFFVEYVYNKGPDDWGVGSYARAAVENKTGSSWAKVRILGYYANFNKSEYELAYWLPDGRTGYVSCQVDLTGHFTGADVMPSPSK